MKFLVDAQLPRRFAGWLAEAGHDALHTLDMPLKNRTSDAEVVARAVQDGRVVVSKDADFMESYLLTGEPPAASRLRASWLRMRPLRHQALAVRRLLGLWLPGHAVTSHRSGKALSAAPVVVCGGIQHNGVLCKCFAPLRAVPVA